MEEDRIATRIDETKNENKTAATMTVKLPLATWLAIMFPPPPEPDHSPGLLLELEY